MSILATKKSSFENFKIFEITDSDSTLGPCTTGIDVDGGEFNKIIYNKIDQAEQADKENFGYAVGDFLRMPKLYNAEGFDTEKLSNETMRNCSGLLYPESIVHKYYTNISLKDASAEAKIDAEILRATVGLHLCNLSDESNLRELFLDEKTILLHLRVGDIGCINESLLPKISSLSDFFDKFIVIAGIHSAWMHSSMAWGLEESEAKARALENAKASFKQIYRATGGFDWLVCDPDVAMCAAYLSKSLFVHRGGFSAALGLLSRGKIYATNALEHFQDWDEKPWTTWEQSLSKSANLIIL